MADNGLKLMNIGAALVTDADQPKPKSTLTPEYKEKNKKDIQDTFKYDEKNDFNSKIKKWLGLD